MLVKLNGDGFADFVGEINGLNVKQGGEQSRRVERKIRKVRVNAHYFSKLSFVKRVAF